MAETLTEHLFTFFVPCMARYSQLMAQGSNPRFDLSSSPPRRAHFRTQSEAVVQDSMLGIF
uniref:Uncharacterized protein n=1 Tax=Ciona intestinalis TaxID=7719 RepID=F7ANH0_CIOIN